MDLSMPPSKILSANLPLWLKCCSNVAISPLVFSGQNHQSHFRMHDVVYLINFLSGSKQSSEIVNKAKTELCLTTAGFRLHIQFPTQRREYFKGTVVINEISPLFTYSFSLVHAQTQCRVDYSFCAPFGEMPFGHHGMFVTGINTAGCTCKRM